METFTKLSEVAGPCGLTVGQTSDHDLFRAVRVAELAVLRAIGMSSVGPANGWLAGEDEDPATRDPIFNQIQVGPAAARHPYLVRWSGGFEAPEVQPDASDLIPNATYVTAPDELVLAAATLACRVLKKQCGGDSFSSQGSQSSALVEEATGLIGTDRFRRVTMGIDTSIGWLAPTWPVNEARVFRRHPTFKRYFYDEGQGPDEDIAESDYTGPNAFAEVKDLVLDSALGFVAFHNPLPMAVRP